MHTPALVALVRFVSCGPRRRIAKREVDGLKTVIVCLRRDLSNKQQYASRLEFLLRQRTAKIDALHGRLEQARAANHRLKQECEHLAQLVSDCSLRSQERRDDGLAAS